jgi:hypothetical protein
MRNDFAYLIYFCVDFEPGKTAMGHDPRFADMNEKDWIFSGSKTY